MKGKNKISDKFLRTEDLCRVLKQSKEEGKTVVFTNGCFDILHRGHVDYLEKAADLGDILVVAVNTDASVKRQGKSPSRPIQDEFARASVLAALASVDYVTLFDEDTPALLIEQISPDVLVKGADYKPENIVGYDHVMAHGGRVETIGFLPGYSTTSIEQKIINNRD